MYILYISVRELYDGSVKIYKFVVIYTYLIVEQWSRLVDGTVWSTCVIIAGYVFNSFYFTLATC